MAAAEALIQMAAHRGGATLLDGYQDFKMHPGEPRGGLVHESVAGGGYDIGQLQVWPLHSLLAGTLFQGFGSTRVSESSGLGMALRCRSDRCRYRLVVFRSAWPSRS